MSASSVLAHFGFPDSMVHEAEDKADMLTKLEQLQDRPTTGSRPNPIIIFLGKSKGVTAEDFCAHYLHKSWPREPYIVGTLSKRMALSPDVPTDTFPFFHSVMPKSFEMPKVQACLLECHRWWLLGGGAPKGVAKLKSWAPEATEAPGPNGDAAAGRVTPTEEVKEEAPAQSQQQAPATTAEAQTNEPEEKQEQEAREETIQQKEEKPSNEAADAVGEKTIAPAPLVAGTCSQPLQSPKYGHALEQDHEAAAPTEDTLSSLPDKGDEGYEGGGKGMQCLGDLLQPAPPFHDCEALQLIGRGSYGRVYRARWGISTVALKVIDQCEADDNFEGALAETLSHPNLVQTFKSATRQSTSLDHRNREKYTSDKSVDGVSELWIIQEWCDLGTLNETLCRKFKVAPEVWFPEVTEVCAEISSAMSYLHSRGIIHSDLTGGNVLLVWSKCKKGYTTKVCDFGLSRVLGEKRSKIDTMSLGTVSYMPPEMFKLDGCSLTKRVDVYSFGVVMWQLLSGKIPFEGLLPTQVVVAVAAGAVLELPPDVPEPLGKVWKSCMMRNPEERSEMSQIFSRIRDLVDLEPSLAQRGRESRRDARRAKRKAAPGVTAVKFTSNS